MFLINCYYIIKTLITFNKNHPIFRIFFTVYYFVKYRKLLKNCLIHKYELNKLINLENQAHLLDEFHVDKLISLNIANLKINGIKFLILDFDGVLSTYGEDQPLSEVIYWLEEAIANLGAKKIFILSNNPSLSRKIFLDKYFTENIIFVISKPKPYIDGIEYIKGYLLQELHQKPLNSEILLVDDRLATGILAAKIAGISSCLILNPYINMNKKFIVELIFIILRSFERLLLYRV